MPPEEGTPPADAGQQGDQGGTTTPPAAPPADAGTQPGTPDGGQTSQSDDSAAVIARLNAEARDNRLRAEAAEAKLAEHDRAKLSETERLQAELADAQAAREQAEARAQQLALSQAVTAAATKANAKDATLVMRALDASAVEFDSTGQPTNLDKLIAQVKKDHPILFDAVAGDGDQGPRSAAGLPTGDMNELIRRGARRGAA